MLGQHLRHAQGGIVGECGQGQELDLIRVGAFQLRRFCDFDSQLQGRSTRTPGEGPDQCPGRGVEGHNTSQQLLLLEKFLPCSQAQEQ